MIRSVSGLRLVGKLIKINTTSFIKRFSTMKNFKTIGTHDGVFHCDEVLGCVMLKLLCPDAEIVRTRNENKLSQCDIVIDVGSIYNPDNYRFDHHQRGFNHTMSSLIPGKPWTITLSSAGLVYCHYGKEIIRKIIQDIKDDDVDKIFDRVYENFIQEIDGIDNGIPISDGELKYTINTNLSARVKNLNQRWNEDLFNEEEAFKKAMDLVAIEFKDKVLYYFNDWLPCRDIVLEAIRNRFNVHKSGEVMELTRNCPWKAHFFELEKELNPEPQIKFVLFETSANWRVQAVSLDEHNFNLRLPLMESWRGLREDELYKASGVNGILFVHGSGFIGGCHSKEGALEMAVKTLEENSRSK